MKEEDEEDEEDELLNVRYGASACCSSLKFVFLDEILTVLDLSS